MPVVVDGGFMRGADVVKGLCLGADFVGMGRFESLPWRRVVMPD